MANEFSQKPKQKGAVIRPAQPIGSTVVKLQKSEAQDGASILHELQDRVVRQEKRINQLYGERKQLAKLLKESLDAIQSLNREIGSLESKPKKQIFDAARWDWQAGGTRLADMMRNVDQLVARVRRVVKPEMRTTEPKDKAPASKSLSLVPHAKTTSPKPILAVVALGLSSDEVEAIMPRINSVCAHQNFMPLLLIDHDDFRKLRSLGVLFEYLPPKGDRERFAPDLHWDVYFQRRLANLRKKWNPAKVISFGSVSSELVELWGNSIFEPTPIPVPSDSQISANGAMTG